MKISVKMRKNETGEEFVYRNTLDYVDLPDYSAVDSILYGWLEGNDSCDCNRTLYYYRSKGLPEPKFDELVCGDEKRFSLISITNTETGEVIYKS